MTISAKYIAVKRTNEKKADGEFAAVEPADSFVYKGEVAVLPDETVYVGNRPLSLRDTVLFAKYSPDTFEVDDRDFYPEKVKLVKRDDILAII